MIYAVSFVALAVIAGLIFELSRVRRLYESVYQLVLTDRDTARKEVETLRAALFPQLARMSSPPSGVAPGAKAERAASQPASARSVPNLESLFKPRIPWRIRFKQLAQQHNTQQRGRDSLAAAISQSKETPHA